MMCASEGVAGTTGLEPATSDVTGRRSNQLNYVPFLCSNVGQSKDNTGPALPWDTQSGRRAVKYVRPKASFEYTPASLASIASMFRKPFAITA